ncbi:MAG: hypothetical protein KAW94_02925 [Candidatus Thorarchaeota archaeon]|nr:hypothetical protein [Candidatus Thorarchaeota archaeon]
MSKKTQGTSSFKSLEKQLEQVTFRKNERILIISSPHPGATLSAALLSTAILRSSRTFHITFVHPHLDIEKINSIRKTHANSAIIAVGIDVYGKRRLKKGTSYPVFIGGMLHSEHNESPSIGSASDVAAAAYILAKERFKINDRTLQLAAAGTLIHNTSNMPLKGASRKVVSLAEKGDLLKERKGFKLFGSNFLPAVSALLYSTFPYLKGISGVQERCEHILEEANIPISKRRGPITSLDTKEAQRLTSQLIPNLDSTAIPGVLGQDFSFPTESEESPLHLLSGIKALSQSAWSRWDLGASVAVWMGDRARILRSFIDSHMAHTRDVIAGIQNLASSLNKATSEDSDLDAIVTIPLVGTHESVLPDVARIALQSYLVNKDGFVMLTTEACTEVAWDTKKASLHQVTNAMNTLGLVSVPTSASSLKLETTSPNEQGIIAEALCALGGSGS